jgi:hypothetical protein
MPSALLLLRQRRVTGVELTVAADNVPVAHHLPKLSAHLATALAHMHFRNLARRSSLEVGSTREKRGGEEERNVKNSVWLFGTGNRKCRWYARVYPKRENDVILPLLPLVLWTPYKALWVWAGAVAKYLLRPRARCSSPRPATRRCRNRRRETWQMRSGEGRIYPALSVQWQVHPRGDVPSKSFCRWPPLCNTFGV